MRTDEVVKFSNSFLFLDGDQALVQSPANDSLHREKRAHHKSRNGCVACKRRRVKCDEAFPCGNCNKRKETCERPRRPSPPLPRLKVVYQPAPQPLPQVNTFHIELFYHFEKLTLPTLAFGEIWPVVLQMSFQNEFLMHAILSVAAKHLSILRPQDLRYAQASMVMLNKSIQTYRETLGTPITKVNCDVRLGTSILINYMSWSDLGFLDGQDTAGGGLDLSGDLLFLLSSGVRQLFFSAYQVFWDHGSIFTTIVRYSPCDQLEEEADRRGLDWRGTWERLKAVFDDPRYVGTTPDLGTEDSFCSTVTRDWDETARWYYGNEGWETVPSWYCRLTSSSAALHAFTVKYLTRLTEVVGDQTLAMKLVEQDITARSIYDRIARRLSVLLALIPDDDEMEAASSRGETVPATLSEARLRDAERYFFSFPMIFCFGPFLPLIRDGDSRALLILYHTYRAARRFLTSDRAWWSGQRAEVMERLILQEFQARGLDPGL